MQLRSDSIRAKSVLTKRVSVGPVFVGGGAQNLNDILCKDLAIHCRRTDYFI